MPFNFSIQDVMNSSISAWNTMIQGNVSDYDIIRRDRWLNALEANDPQVLSFVPTWEGLFNIPVCYNFKHASWPIWNLLDRNYPCECGDQRHPPSQIKYKTQGRDTAMFNSKVGFVNSQYNWTCWFTQEVTPWDTAPDNMNPGQRQYWTSQLGWARDDTWRNWSAGPQVGDRYPGNS